MVEKCHSESLSDGARLTSLKTDNMPANQQVIITPISFGKGNCIMVKAKQTLFYLTSCRRTKVTAITKWFIWRINLGQIAQT